jgi:hypothetical protein
MQLLVYTGSSTDTPRHVLQSSVYKHHSVSAVDTQLAAVLTAHETQQCAQAQCVYMLLICRTLYADFGHVTL